MASLPVRIGGNTVTIQVMSSGIGAALAINRSAAADAAAAQSSAGAAETAKTATETARDQAAASATSAGAAAAQSVAAKNIALAAQTAAETAQDGAEAQLALVVDAGNDALADINGAADDALSDIEDAAAALFYADTAAGLAAVSEGGFFKVIVDGRIITYQDVAGVAVERSVAPKKADVDVVQERTFGQVKTDPVLIDGRYVQPTVLSFDLYVSAGVYLDTGGPYSPLDPDAGSMAVAEAAAAKVSPLVSVEPVEIGGRMVQPTALSFDLYVIAGFYTDTGAPYAAVAASSSARTERVYEAYAGAPAALPTKLGFEAYGQSNSNGSYSSVVTDAAKYTGRVLTFNGGVKADPDNPGTTMTGTEDLLENSDVVPNNSAPGATGPGGETIVSGASYGFLDRAYRRLGGPLSSLPLIFGHTSGMGGANIATLSVSGASQDQWYDRFTTSVQEAFDVNGAGFAIGAVLFNHGEANQGITTQASYQASLRALYNQMIASVIGITGQTFDPIMVVAQKAWAADVAVGVVRPGGGSAVVEQASVTLAAVAEQGEGIFCAYPDYCIPMDEGDIHYSGVGTRIAGEYDARCIERVLVRKQDWRGLSVRSAWSIGTTLYIRLDPSVAPVVLDYSGGVVDQSGFALEDGSGDLPLSAVSVCDDGETLQATMSRAISGTAELRYALDHQSFTTVDGPGGNVRDSDTETVSIDGGDYTLANWCFASITPVLVMEA
jgi:hypothetical protein